MDAGGEETIGYPIRRRGTCAICSAASMVQTVFGIPEGCQILAGGRREAETTGNLGKTIPRLGRGCQK